LFRSPWHSLWEEPTMPSSTQITLAAVAVLGALALPACGAEDGAPTSTSVSSPAAASESTPASADDGDTYDMPLGTTVKAQSQGETALHSVTISATDHRPV